MATCLIMTSMITTGLAWFSLIVGVALLAEAAVFVLSRRPYGGRHGPRGGPWWPMLLSTGVMLISESAARLDRLTGAGLMAALLVEVASFVATVVFVIRA